MAEDRSVGCAQSIDDEVNCPKRLGCLGRVFRTVLDMVDWKTKKGGYTNEQERCDEYARRPGIS